MTEWSDGRLDDLGRRVDDGFVQMREEFGEVNKKFDRLEGRIDHLGERFDAFQRTLMQIGAGIFVALVGLVATQV